jgi:hypothetical protein
MTTPSKDDKPEKPPPPPIIASPEEAQAIARNNNMNLWYPSPFAASYPFARTPLASLARPNVMYDQMQGFMFPQGCIPTELGTDTRPIQTLVAESDSPNTKKDKCSATASAAAVPSKAPKKTRDVYTYKEMETLVDAVDHVKPYEEKHGWEKVKKRFDQLTKTSGRKAKALKSKYESMAKAMDDDPKLGRFKKRIQNHEAREFIRNEVATSVPNFPGSLASSSNDADGGDKSKDEPVVGARNTKKSAKDNELKRKKRKQRLEVVRANKKRLEEKEKKEGEYYDTITDVLKNHLQQGGQGVHERVAKLEIETNKKFKTVDNKLDLILKKLE